MANLTFVRQADGTASMRERKGGRDPQTGPQRATRGAMGRVVEAWQGLDDDARNAWEAYAELLHALGPTPSLGRARSGYRVFSSLGLKALQVAPEGEVPSLPPAAPFYGDGARVAVSGVAAFGREALALLPRPPLSQAKEGESGVVFACLAPNSAGVATELLLQPLASPGRKGEADKYRTRGFVSFAAAGEEAFVPCAPGVVLAAVRFVEAATGQASGIVPLGRLRVGTGG